MGWEELLAEEHTIMILPWIGGRTIFGNGRQWKIQGDLPEEYGWYSFNTSGNRKTNVVEKAEAPFGWESEHKRTISGYMVGNRLVPDGSLATLNPEEFANNSLFVHLVEVGLERFSRAKVVQYEQQYYLYAGPEFPLGPENEVFEAFLERKETLDGIKDVTPSLDFTFRFENWIRHEREKRRRLLEERRRQEEVRRQEEERRQAFMKQIGSGEGRRRLATIDFEAAATAALQVSGAQFLDSRPSPRSGEQIVQFRYERHRFECVVDKRTLHVVDAGICLRGNDRLFTLESLPPVISQAIRQGVLHVFRNADNYNDLRRQANPDFDPDEEDNGW